MQNKNYWEELIAIRNRIESMADELDKKGNVEYADIFTEIAIFIHNKEPRKCLDLIHFPL